MTDADDTFTTDSSPPDQPFESTVNDAIALFEAAIATEDGTAADSGGGDYGC